MNFIKRLCREFRLIRADLRCAKAQNNMVNEFREHGNSGNFRDLMQKFIKEECKRATK